MIWKILGVIVITFVIVCVTGFIGIAAASVGGARGNAYLAVVSAAILLIISLSIYVIIKIVN